VDEGGLKVRSRIGKERARAKKINPRSVSRMGDTVRSLITLGNYPELLGNLSFLALSFRFPN